MGPPANNQRCQWNRVWCSKLTRLLRGGHSRFSRLDSHGNCQNHEGKRNHHRLAARCRRRHFSAKWILRKTIEFFVRSFFVFVSNVRKFDFCQQKFTGFIYFIWIFCACFSFDYWHASSALSGALQIFDIRDRLILPTAVSQQYLYQSIYFFFFLHQNVNMKPFETSDCSFCFSSSSLCCRSTGCRMTQSLPTRSANLVVVDEEQMARACFKSQIIDEQISSLNDGNQTSGNLSCQFVGVT